MNKEFSGWTADEVRDLLLKIAGGPISVTQRVELFDIASNYAEHLEAATLRQQAARVDEYALGWRMAAQWAGRDDLIADIGSPAYEKDKAANLITAAALAQNKQAERVDVARWLAVNAQSVANEVSPRHIQSVIEDMQSAIRQLSGNSGQFVQTELLAPVAHDALSRAVHAFDGWDGGAIVPGDRKFREYMREALQAALAQNKQAERTGGEGEAVGTAVRGYGGSSHLTFAHFPMDVVPAGTKLYLHPPAQQSGVAVSDEVRDSVAKIIADRIGNGMREKYYPQADAIIEAVAPLLRAPAEQGEFNSELANNLANALVDPSKLSDDNTYIHVDCSDAFRASELLRTLSAERGGRADEVAKSIAEDAERVEDISAALALDKEG